MTDNPARDMPMTIYVLTGYDSQDGQPCVLGAYSSPVRARIAQVIYGRGTKRKPIKWVSVHLDEEYTRVSICTRVTE